MSKEQTTEPATVTFDGVWTNEMHVLFSVYWGWVFFRRFIVDAHATIVA